MSTEFSPTDLHFRTDWYAKTIDCTCLGVGARGLVVDRTVFYPTGGGQPGDSGTLVDAKGRTVPILTTVWEDSGKTVVAHQLAEGVESPQPGDALTLVLDWPQRLLRMRTHTALHLLSVALPYPVTGGAVGEGEGRLDFDIPELVEKDDVQARIDVLCARSVPVSERWITDAELDANPGLVKTMSVQPPRGSGRIRLIDIDGLDLQPCGGTHVATTGEIGRIEITQIEKKGRLNRRVRLRLL